MYCMLHTFGVKFKYSGKYFTSKNYVYWGSKLLISSYSAYKNKLLMRKLNEMNEEENKTKAYLRGLI